MRPTPAQAAARRLDTAARHLGAALLGIAPREIDPHTFVRCRRAIAGLADELRPLVTRPATPWRKTA